MAYNWEQGPSKHEFEGLFAARDGDPGDPADRGGTTATGLPVGWGIVAVDPSVIPLGTHMTVPGYGEAVAADVGGAVIGNTIDLWFPSVGQAQQWGRRVVTITLH